MTIRAFACALALVPLLVAQNVPAAGSKTGSQVITQQELITEHGPELKTARLTEILMRDRKTFIGRITGFSPNTLNLRMASAKDALPVAVPLEDIIAVRYQMAKKASRLRVIAGGILGGIGGLVVGTPIAFCNRV